MDKKTVVSAEQARDKASAQVSEQYIAEITQIEEAYENSAKRDADIYRKCKAEARERFDNAIKAAEAQLAADNTAAETIYSNAPVTARDEYQKAKLAARERYNKAKLEIESRFNEATTDK